MADSEDRKLLQAIVTRIPRSLLLDFLTIDQAAKILTLAEPPPADPLPAVGLRSALRIYLHTLVITADNIGSIRRSLFKPAEWNAWVREDTAALEQTGTSARETHRAQLRAPCAWCDYNGPGYWQAGTHKIGCPWHPLGGEENRRDVLKCYPERIFRT